MKRILLGVVKDILLFIAFMAAAGVLTLVFQAWKVQ
jgi:hypothetical protein